MRFIEFVAHNFLELKPHIQGKNCYVYAGNEVRIGTGYALLKHSLDFDRYDYRIEAAYSDTEFFIKGITKSSK